jgi:gliding motility-associated-like protein
VNVTDSLRINSNAAVTNVSCHGLADGKLALNPVGGTGPYIGANDSLYKNESLSFSGFIAGTYTFYIKDTIGCKADTTINIMQPQPLAIETSVSNASCYTGIPDGKILVVVKGGTEPYNYTWSTSSNIKTQEATGLTVGTYPISIADANLCKDSIDAVVEYDDCCTPYIPTAFTPNGDGKNDLFRIKVKGDMKLVAFKVYNRFGQVVFSTEDVDMGWDGTVNGTLQDIGTYYYFIKATCGNSNEHPVSLKGDITLIR